MSRQADLSSVIWSAMVSVVKPGSCLANSTVLMMHLVDSSLNLSHRLTSRETRCSELLLCRRRRDRRTYGEERRVVCGLRGTLMVSIWSHLTSVPLEGLLSDCLVMSVKSSVSSSGFIHVDDWIHMTFPGPIQVIKSNVYDHIFSDICVYTSKP